MLRLVAIAVLLEAVLVGAKATGTAALAPDFGSDMKPGYKDPPATQDPVIAQDPTGGLGEGHSGSSPRETQERGYKGWSHEGNNRTAEKAGGHAGENTGYTTEEEKSDCCLAQDFDCVLPTWFAIKGEFKKCCRMYNSQPTCMCIRKAKTCWNKGETADDPAGKVSAITSHSGSSYPVAEADDFVATAKKANSAVA